MSEDTKEQHKLIRGIVQVSFNADRSREGTCPF